MYDDVIAYMVGRYDVHEGAARCRGVVFNILACFDRFKHLFICFVVTCQAI